MSNQGILETVQLDKKIIIDNATAKKLEANGAILESDAYIERDTGEKSAPSQFLQQVVDAETAVKLAREKGITLAPTIESTLNRPMPNTPVTTASGRVSNMPSAILESFRQKPPLAPTAEMTAPQFNDDAIEKIKSYNKRLNKVDGMPIIPKNASQSLTEQVHPEALPQPGANTQIPFYQQVSQQPTYSNNAGTSGIDYSVLAALIKESIREVLKDVNIKEMVKEVLTEEREKIKKTKIDENIEIKIGNNVFGGKIKMLSQQPKK